MARIGGCLEAMTPALRLACAMCLVAGTSSIAQAQEATPPPSNPALEAPPTASAKPRTAAPRAREHRRQRPPSQPWRKRKPKHAHESAEATAAPEKDRAHLILGYERATGVLHWTVRGTDIGEMRLSNRTSGTDIAFLGGGSAANANIFGIPRIGFDALYGHFTAGGSLIYLRSATNVGNGDTLIVSPRLGALFPKSTAVRAWLRGGASYASVSSDITGISNSGGVVDLGQAKVSLFDLTLEPLLLIMASKQVAMTLGASLDIGIAGSASVELATSSGVAASSSDSDLTASSYGVTAGLLAIF